MNNVLNLQMLEIDPFDGDRVAQFSCSSCAAFSCGAGPKTSSH